MFEIPSEKFNLQQQQQQQVAEVRAIAAAATLTQTQTLAHSVTTKQSKQNQIELNVRPPERRPASSLRSPGRVQVTAKRSN